MAPLAQGGDNFPIMWIVCSACHIRLESAKKTMFSKMHMLFLQKTIREQNQGSPDRKHNLKQEATRQETRRQTKRDWIVTSFHKDPTSELGREGPFRQRYGAHAGRGNSFLRLRTLLIALSPRKRNRGTHDLLVSKN